MADLREAVLASCLGVGLEDFPVFRLLEEAQQLPDELFDKLPNEVKDWVNAYALAHPIDENNPPPPLKGHLVFGLVVIEGGKELA